MKMFKRYFVLFSVITPLRLLATVCLAYGQIVDENLPINTMLTIKASNEPINRKTVPRKILRYCSYESQIVPDYIKVARFQVVPGQKYTFYYCHPATPDTTKINIYLVGDTPITNYTQSYGRSVSSCNLSKCYGSAVQLQGAGI